MRQEATERMQDSERKFEAAMEELVRAGIQKSARATGFLRLMRAVGFKSRPRLYASLFSNSVVWGTTFAIIWGVIMNVLMLAVTSVSGSITLVSTLISGAIFGIITAMFLSHVHRRKKLSAWKDL